MAKGMELAGKLPGISCRVVNRKNDLLEVKKSENFPTVHENPNQGKGN
jgi:hypothetical protein